MKSSLSDGSAKIYQFPVGGRAGLMGRSYGETPSPIDQTPHMNETICSSSWYHEEAIQESRPGPKPGWDH